MPHLVSRRWEGNPGAPGGRHARRSFSYDAFIPHRIADLLPSLRLDVAERMFEATRSIGLAATASPEGALEEVDVRRAIEALELLTGAGVLHRLGSQARNRRYEAIDLFELVSAFEQDVASGHIPH